MTPSHRVKTALRTSTIAARSRIGFDPTTSVLVAGIGRSGTTWFADVLSNATNSAILFEPDHEAAGAIPVEYRRRHGQSILDAPAATVAEMYRELLRGRGANDWSVRDLKQFVQGRRLIVKTVRATPHVLDLAGQGVLSHAAVLVRHPCAVIASRLRADVFSAPGLERHTRLLDEVPAVAKLIGRDPTPVALQALYWVSHYRPYSSGHPTTVPVVAYEHLHERPHEVGSRLSTALNLSTTLDPTALRHASATDFTADLRRSEAQLDKWRDRLTERDITMILEIVHSCGIDMYGAGSRPTGTPLMGLV